MSHKQEKWLMEMNKFVEKTTLNTHVMDATHL